jgi:ubiquinone/menaquinone biosynthesis C-methylase UbiE
MDRPTPVAVPIGNTYDKYSSRNPIERRLMQGFFSALDASLPTSRPSRILEVGVGEGEVARRVSQRWPAVPYLGIDLPDQGLSKAWKIAGLAGAFADVAWLPFPAGSFDLVLAIEVLEHVADPDRALRELARVSALDVVLSVPHEPVWRAANLVRGKYLASLGNTPGHVNHWSKRGFARLVSRHLTLDAVRSPFPWTMAAARRS